MLKNQHMEYKLSIVIANYIKAKYPNVLYHFDFSGVYLPKGYIIKYGLHLLNNKKGYPDFFIIEQRGDFKGLFIEIKDDGKTPFKKNGQLKSGEHIENQSKYHEELKKKRL